MEDRTKIKEALASMLKNKGEREAFAQLLVEYIDPNHVVQDVIGLLLNTRRLKPGDALIKKVRKGIKAYTHVPGAIPLKSEITVSDRINYILDMAIVSVTANEWELESGEIGTVADIRREALAALKDYYLNKVFTALSTIWNASNTPDNYVAVSGAVTETALKNAIKRINRVTPGVRAIVGTRTALNPITEFGTFWADTANNRWQGVDSQLEEVMRTGMLGVYNGAQIVALNQVFDNPEDNRPLLPDNKVLVIGGEVGEFILYGDPKVKEWTDMRPTPPQWNFDVYQQFGMIIDNAEGIYVIDIV